MFDRLSQVTGGNMRRRCPMSRFVLTCFPMNRKSRIESSSFRVLELRRLWLPCFATSVRVSTNEMRTDARRSEVVVDGLPLHHIPVGHRRGWWTGPLWKHQETEGQTRPRVVGSIWKSTSGPGVKSGVDGQQKLEKSTFRATSKRSWHRVRP